MSFEERYEMHLNESKTHRENARQALKKFIEDHSVIGYWEEYKKEDKASNKHWGIAQAMFTRKYGRA